MSAHWWISVVLGGALAAFVGCVGSSDADGPGASQIDTGDDDDDGGGVSSTDGGNYVISSDALGNEDSTSFEEDACAADMVESQLTPVNMIFIFDKSGSMGDDANGDWANRAIRWEPVKAGVLAFFEEPGSEHLFASLDFFPARGGLETACDPAQYNDPLLDVRMTSLDNNDLFISVLDATEPSGGTPTWPAMRGSLDYAIELTQQDPNAKTVVVLITDGEPGLMSTPVDSPDADLTMKETCYEYGYTDVPNTIPEVVSIVQDAYETYGIKTYVIGIEGAPGALADLSMIAAAGGTEPIFLSDAADPAVTRTTLQAELSGIRTEYLSCSMAMPEAEEDGEPVDMDKVNVTISMNGQEVPLDKVQGCGGGLGWQYLYVGADGALTSTAPSEDADPASIELCPNTCQTVQGTAGVQLIVEIGCLTRAPE